MVVGEMFEQYVVFEVCIVCGEKIEFGDWMFVEYCCQLICMILQYVYSEVVGMLFEGEWIVRVFSFKCKIILMVKVQDEVGYGQYFYYVVEMLGVICEEMFDVLLMCKVKYFFIFNYFILIWVDVGMIGWLVDGVVIKNQIMLVGCFYGFYSWVMVWICSEEIFYYKQGKEMMVFYVQGMFEQWQMVQDVLNCWWWFVVQMFGLYDSDSFNIGVLSKWGIKFKINDEVCQEFINEYVFELFEVGLIIFDFDLYQDEVGNWVYGLIDWSEFWVVIKGEQGLGNECFVICQVVQDEGVWVCEVLEVYMVWQVKGEVVD